MLTNQQQFTISCEENHIIIQIILTTDLDNQQLSENSTLRNISLNLRNCISNTVSLEDAEMATFTFSICKFDLTKSILSEFIIKRNKIFWGVQIKFKETLEFILLNTDNPRRNILYTYNMIQKLTVLRSKVKSINYVLPPWCT